VNDARLSDITRLAIASARLPAECRMCGGSRWRHDTNGDGSTLAICERCGATAAIGRWWQDAAVGVRVPAESAWSALKQA
jgi:hypothetical protein